MYIAIKNNKGKFRYILRKSCVMNGKLISRDLFDLKDDPSLFIQYAGGNAFYFDKKTEDALSQSNADCDSNSLENIFWPWVRPDIRQAIDMFRHRSYKACRKKLTDEQKDQIATNVPCFDKRRTMFLKFVELNTASQRLLSEVP